jgi:hypothetical protein
MGRGITKRLLDGLKDTVAGLPDKRGASNGRKYGRLFQNFSFWNSLNNIRKMNFTGSYPRF